MRVQEKKYLPPTVLTESQNSRKLCYVKVDMGWLPFLRHSCLGVSCANQLRQLSMKSNMEMLENHRRSRKLWWFILCKNHSKFSSGNSSYPTWMIEAGGLQFQGLHVLLIELISFEAWRGLSGKSGRKEHSEKCFEVRCSANSKRKERNGKAMG
jgi:hypothetical protein